MQVTADTDEDRDPALLREEHRTDLKIRYRAVCFVVGQHQMPEDCYTVSVA